MTPFELAQRYTGIKERTNGEHPLIQWWLSLCKYGLDVADEVPWCSAFVNGIAWEFRLPRSYSAAARSWLEVGLPIQLSEARPNNDIVILSRGPIKGHVGFFASIETGTVHLLGGNQSDSVCIGLFGRADILGVRRLQ